MDSFDCVFSNAGQEEDKVCVPPTAGMDDYISKMEDHDDFSQSMNNEMDCEH